MIKRLERLKKDITEIRGIMISVSTGRGVIDDLEEKYQRTLSSIKDQLKNFQKEDINFPDLNYFYSLWDFYSYYRSELKTYRERREYIQSLYKPIDEPITQVLMKISKQKANSDELVKLLSSFIANEPDHDELKISISSAKKSNDLKQEEQTQFKYDLAISFAGEDRKIAEDLAEELQTRNVRVFYDEFYKSDLWGKKLTKHFQKVYGPKSRFVVVLISRHYPVKDWTDFEFYIIREEAKKREIEFILPIKLDETKILGIHEDIAYLDYRKEGISGIVSCLLEKLGTPFYQESENVVEKLKLPDDIWNLSEFNRTDLVVLGIVGDIIYQKDDFYDWIDFHQIIKKISDFNISEKDITESLEFLASNGLLKLSKSIERNKPPLTQVTPLGFMEYSRNFLTNFNVSLKDVISSIVNKGLQSNNEISSDAGCKLVIVDGLLEYFHAMGYIKLIRGHTKYNEILQITALGKRFFKRVLQGREINKD